MSRLFYTFLLPIIRTIATEFLLKFLNEIIVILQKRQDNNINELDQKSIARRIETARDPEAKSLSHPDIE